MRRRTGDGSKGSTIPTILLSLFTIACLVYTTITLSHRKSVHSFNLISSSSSYDLVEEEKRGDCCRGKERWELWGRAVKWGEDFRLNSSRDCCKACKDMCSDDGCECNSWVFCGDRVKCKEKYGQCWLKKQDDPMFPGVMASGEHVMWTSGIVFGKEEGVIALDTNYGTIRIKLFSDCAPHSVNFFTELLNLKYSLGCHFYRAEPRGLLWDEQGDHIEKESVGPPYGLIQGTLEVEGSGFQGLPREACMPLRRGTVAWIGSGPDFIISLANHDEWHRSYTTFGAVVSEDMDVVETIADLPTRHDEWNGVEVKVLENPVEFKVSIFKASEK